jgi:hypothetical protein
MALLTIYRLAEECKKLVDGGDAPAASSISLNEAKIAIGQIANSLLKTDYLQINSRIGETIPNGSVLGYYPDLVVESWKGKSRVKLPVKPQKLPRDMGVWSIFPSDQPDKEFIPLEMGQWSLLQSQPLLNGLLGQIGRETYGEYVVFTKDITIPGETVTVDMRLVIMDISLYGDFDLLPLLPEHEFQIKQEFVKLYSQQPTADRVVDSTVKEQQNVPINQQKQS